MELPLFSTVLCLFGAVFLTLLIAVSTSIRIVPESKRLTVYRLGRLIGDKGPGIVLVIPGVDHGVLKDLGAPGEITPSRRLVGAVGETRSSVHEGGGEVVLGGEVWDAVSRFPISTGQRVRVVRMILEVEQE